MMRVINFAHGEFLMLGGYAVILPVQAGVNLWIAMLVIAPLVVGLFGVVVERLIIRPLYGRVIDTVLATWGLSLLMIGVASAATLLGAVNQVVTFVATPVVGEVALLAAAIILLRLLPAGITGRLFRGGI
jgi:branched-chain amino acid transport system permease protein